MKKVALLALFLVVSFAYAQKRPIKVVEEKIPNRLALYAVNENDADVDVKITISGTNFRQSKAKPRFIRVPGASKVHLKTIILMRGKNPSYTYDLVVNDSLSKRAIRKEAIAIKIRPDKNITVYIPEMCEQCDSLLRSLSESKYLFESHKLGENVNIKEQLNRSFANNVELDSLKSPIINLGGKLFTRINTYEDLISKLDFEDQE